MCTLFEIEIYLGMKEGEKRGKCNEATSPKILLDEFDRALTQCHSQRQRRFNVTLAVLKLNVVSIFLPFVARRSSIVSKQVQRPIHTILSDSD